MNANSAEHDSPGLSLRRLTPALVAYAAPWVAMLAGAATTVLLVSAFGRDIDGWFVLARPYYIGFGVHVIVGLLLAHLLRRKGPTLPLRPTSSPARSALVIALWGAVLGLVIAVAFYRRETADRFPFGPDPLTASGVLAFLAHVLVLFPAAALMEELLFRGTLQPRLQAVFGERAALIVTAVAFALCHVDGTPAIALGLGLVTGWLALRHGTIWPAVWFHLGYNEALHVGQWAWSARGVPEIALAAMLGLILLVLHAGGMRKAEVAPEPPAG